MADIVDNVAVVVVVIGVEASFLLRNQGQGRKRDITTLVTNENRHVDLSFFEPFQG